MWNTCGFKLRQSLCLSLVYLQTVPAAWRLLKPPPAVCWGSGTPMSADPVAGCCRRELPPELRVTAPAPCSPAAAFLLACKQTHPKLSSWSVAFQCLLYNKKTSIRHLERRCERMPYRWREFAVSRSFELASWRDSFIFTDDLSKPFWPSICKHEIQSHLHRLQCGEQMRAITLC